jgi:hypothetical protein
MDLHLRTGEDVQFAFSASLKSGLDHSSGPLGNSPVIKGDIPRGNMGISRGAFT